MPIKPPGSPELDLTTDDSFGVINFAVFQTGENQSAGTGIFNPFVQLQHTGTEEGYNTDARPQFDEKTAVNHNHSVLLADVPIVIGDGANGTLEGVAYREFLLDLNEMNGGYISLDALQIWQEESGSLTNFTPRLRFCRRAHELPGLRSRRRRRQMDRTDRRTIAWQRAERLSHSDSGQFLH